MIFSWLKYRSSFISRSVLKQNMEWSKGVIFLIATFWPDGLCSAELCVISILVGWESGAHLPHHTIRPFSHYILDIILLANIERYFP